MTAALIEEVDLLQLGGKALQKQLADPRLDLGVHKLSHTPRLFGYQNPYDKSMSLNFARIVWLCCLTIGIEEFFDG